MVVNTKTIKLSFFGKPFEVPEGIYATLKGKVLTGFTEIYILSKNPGLLVTKLEQAYGERVDKEKIKKELYGVIQGYKQFSAYPKPDKQNIRAAVHNTINLLEEMLKVVS